MNNDIAKDFLKKKQNVKKTVNENIQFTVEESETTIKKRGRKPKGGKLIVKPQDDNVKSNTPANVILHLKCSLNDLHEYNDKLNKIFIDPLAYNPVVPPTIMSYSDSSVLKYDTITQDAGTKAAYVESVETAPVAKNYVCSVCANDSTETTEKDDGSNMKDINAKLKRLKVDLYKNNLPEKKSACFWCTYEYDNYACYIPKYEMDGTIFGYGSFCRPECAVAYLMKENIDDSTKFERYYLLNNIYSKVYSYKKNIKPAPNPYYLLDKYYGNLTIQEYRKMLKTEHMLLVIEKPLTRILPELHEDNEDTILNTYGETHSNNTAGANNGVYKVKRQSEKQQGPSKSVIMRDKFGFSAQ
jgi:hypothetical protein